MKKAIEALSKEQVKMLLEYIRGEKSQPMDIVFELMLACGMRSHEAVTASISDLDIATGIFNITKPAKGSNVGSYDVLYLKIINIFGTRGGT